MERVLAMPLEDALTALSETGRPVRVVPVTPPKGAKVGRWRVARVSTVSDGVTVVTVVGEIEGTIGCNVGQKQNEVQPPRP